MRLFADDCILYRTISSDADTVILQEDIDKLHSWSLTWQMKFNCSKCHILSISRKRNRPLLLYKLGPDPLSVVSSYPYLGVTISSDLRWNLQVNNVCSKATRTLNFVKRNIYGCSPEAKALAYTSLVRPHLEYASAAWDPHTKQNILQLEKVQRRAARFAKNDHRRATSATQLLADLGWDELATRRRNARLVVLFKAIHGYSAIPLDGLQHPSRFSRSAEEDTFSRLSCRTDSYKYSFFPRTVIDWNALPDTVRRSQTAGSFRGALFSGGEQPPGCC